MKLHIVPAKNGITWFKQGLMTLKRQLLGLSGLFALLISISMLLGVVPVLGAFLSMAMLPLISLSMMLATHKVNQGQYPMPTLLVEILRTGKAQFRALLQLGALYALCAIAILLLGVSMAPDLERLISSADPATIGGSVEASIAIADILPAVAVVAVLMGLSSLIFWHAPALVYWHGIPVLKSLFFSSVACLRNWRAYALLVLVLIGVQLFAVQILFLARMMGLPFEVAMYILSLLLGTLMGVISYYSFVDCFGGPPIEA